MERTSARRRPLRSWHSSRRSIRPGRRPRTTPRGPPSSMHRRRSTWTVAGGMLVLWIVIASPLAALDHALLTFHMVQHLLLMTVAAPLIRSSVPVPRHFALRRSFRVSRLLWSRGLSLASICASPALRPLAPPGPGVRGRLDVVLGDDCLSAPGDRHHAPHALAFEARDLSGLRKRSGSRPLTQAPGLPGAQRFPARSPD